MKSGEVNPRDAKRRLAREIVGIYHSPEAGQEAVDYFVNTFSKRQQPVEAEEAEIPADVIEADGQVMLASLIGRLEMTKSNSEARRLMQAGAVSLDGEKLTDGMLKLAADALRGKTLKVGKHQFRKLV